MWYFHIREIPKYMPTRLWFVLWRMLNSTYNSGSSAKAAAGAVVVISTKDGSVLAASNYPSYDQNHDEIFL